ncbi:MAG TPA: glycosyltransferase [Acidobacteriota bacterium]|nr:glycosyltransferase [Acidobacteriota bacterium]
MKLPLPSDNFLLPDPEYLLAENAELRQQLEEARVQLELQRERVEELESSVFFKLKQRVVRWLNACGLSEQEAWQAHQRQGIAGIVQVILRLNLKRWWQSLGGRFRPNPNYEYDQWARGLFPGNDACRDLERDCRQWKYQPTISLLMPVYNPLESFLVEALESVQAQIYPFWELCIVDDASTMPYVRPVLEDFAAREPRIKLRFLKRNGHIAHASNAALELATGEFVGLVDHDDMLTVDALFEVAKRLNTSPATDFLYSDEDKLNESGQFSEPYFKPDWSPELFLSQMFTGHFSVYRRELVSRLGGFRVGFEGSQDYDLVLRVTEQTDRIIHIPKVLYHWRMHQDSASSNYQAKPYAYVAAQKAISQALTRRGEPGSVQINIRHPGYYTIRFDRPAAVSVGLIVFGTADIKQLVASVESWFTKTTISPVSVVSCLVEAQHQYLKKLIPTTVQSVHRVEPSSQTLNPELLNQAVRQAGTEIIVFLKAGLVVESDEWLELLVEQAYRPAIAAVGGILLQPGRLVRSAGLGLNRDTIAAELHQGLPGTAFGYHGSLITSHNVAALPLTGLACRREVFVASGGLNSQLKARFWDVDLCLRMFNEGYRHVCVPQVRMLDPEPVRSRQTRLNHDPDAEWMRRQWGAQLERDPYYNPNLSRQPMNFLIRSSFEAEQRPRHKPR